MTDMGELRYASREPWAGSAAMFERVPYLRRRNVRVLGPDDGRLEAVLVALQVERFLRLKPEILEGFVRLYEAVMPEATRAGTRVYHSGLLRAMSEDQNNEWWVRMETDFAEHTEGPAAIVAELVSSWSSSSSPELPDEPSPTA